MSEDSSEGEKGDTVGEMPVHGDSARGGRMSRVSSMDTMANLDKKLYLVLIRFRIVSNLRLMLFVNKQYEFSSIFSYAVFMD